MNEQNSKRAVAYVNPRNHHQPAGKYSHAAVVTGGRLAFVAGQVAVDADGTLVGEDDVGAQFRQVFTNLVRVAAAVEAGPSDILELRTFLVGSENLPAFRRSRDEVFTDYFPAGEYPPSTLLVVAGLAAPEFLVEVAATVHVPD